MQAMPQDPSMMVHNQLLPHMHLMSTYQFPAMQRISPGQALQHLMQAGQIVREVKPMAWTYLNPPPDGTIFLTWQAPRMQNHFASDGYVWIDQEMTFRQNISGYIVEILVHRAGYVFAHEQVAAHQRTRYHIIDKDPSLPPVDPAFWLVHYGPADQENRRPVAQFQINPQIQKLMQERVFLEQQGAGLQRKEFMLMDRSNWPTVSASTGVQPRQMHPAYAPQNPAMARQMPPGYPQQPIAQPPSKRVKVDRSLAAQVTAHKDAISDAIFEEDTEFGDYFDTLTPAEISRMRYKQHHEWMEEIFSSVYSMSQIMPEDLGFGLTGSLKELTDGILVAPLPPQTAAATRDGRDDKGIAVQSQGPNSYTKLPTEKMEELERRIARFVEQGKADIQAMKEQHAETVTQFNKSKTYMKAERKLRDINGGDTNAVVQEVESNLHAKITEQRTKMCVEEGGLEREDKSRAANGPAAAAQPSAPSSNGYSGNGNSNGMFEIGDNSAANLLDEFGGGSYTNSPAARIGTPGVSQPQSGVPTPGATASGPEQGFMQQAADAVSDDQQGGDETGLDLLEGMDMDVDVDIPGMGDDGDDGHMEHAKPGAEDDWVMVGNGEQQQVPSESTTTAPPETSSTASASNPAPAAAQSTTDQQPTTATAMTTAEQPPASTVVEAPTSTDTPNEAGGMFDSTDIFEGLDTAGDALVDYDDGDDGDDLGLDLGGGEFDGAFGDADEHHGGDA